MIIKLDGYNDLGKCSFGTLLDDFDAELHDIYLDGKYIEIKKGGRFISIFVATFWNFSPEW